jgi:asparagine synthase (glutamine-hydrolysing)
LREELERDGVSFASGCDTEVLLKAYVQWGYRCVDRLNGMWAFIVWDPRTQTAFFARDRFGVKPFVYTLARERLSIASEPKALLRLFPELRRVDEQSLYDILALGRLHTSELTMYEGIAVLPPAHAGILRVGETKPKIWRYWNFPESYEREAEPVERFSELLHDAVRLRMRSDVPVGVTLSGGLDSTAILEGAVQALPETGLLHAFTSVFPASGGPVQDERQWAEEAARPYRRVALEQVPVAAEWLAVVERMIWHLDAPTFSPAAASLWTIVERARSRGVKVLLEGQGADELLGGYVQHAALALIENRVGGRRRTLTDARAYATTFRPVAFAPWLLRERYPALRHVYRRRWGTASTLKASFSDSFGGNETPPPARRLRQRLVDDMSRDILPALLHYGDAVSMAHSLEARQPFLDYRLVEFCTKLPDEWKVGHGETKRVLRTHLRSIGQERIASRKDKLGFPTPIWTWLTADDGRIPRTLLLNPNSQILRYCMRPALESLLSRTRHDRRTGADHLFRLISTELWLRTCIG